MHIEHYTFGHPHCPEDAMPKAKRQITQLLDTFIEREELKQRVSAQGG